MQVPSYDGVIDPWKVDLIIRRAKLFRLSRHDLADAVQQIVMILRDFDYDTSHANGAQEQTVLTAVIDNRLRMIRRSRRRYRKRVGLLPEDFDACAPDPDGLLRRVDVRMAVLDLSSLQQAICDGLAAGLTRAEIARRLGCDWHTVNRAVRKICTHFAAIGLDGWISG